MDARSLVSKLRSKEFPVQVVQESAVEAACELEGEIMRLGSRVESRVWRSERRVVHKLLMTVS